MACAPYAVGGIASVYICLTAAKLSTPPCMPAACSLKNYPFAALIRCATCVADPSFSRIAPMYFIGFSGVKVVPFSISVASEVKGGFI